MISVKKIKMFFYLPGYRQYRNTFWYKLLKNMNIMVLRRYYESRRRKEVFCFFNIKLIKNIHISIG